MTCENPPVPDPEPELPPITHEGKNTFGCLINGEVWLPDVTDGSIIDHKLTIDITSNSFNIKAQLVKNKKDEWFFIYVTEGFIGVGNYYLNNIKPGIAFYNNFINHYDFQTDSNFTGNIIITTYDIQNRIFAGTFSFFAHSQTSDSTISITDGRFDIKL